MPDPVSVAFSWTWPWWRKRCRSSLAARSRLPRRYLSLLRCSPTSAVYPWVPPCWLLLLSLIHGMFVSVSCIVLQRDSATVVSRLGLGFSPANQPFPLVSRSTRPLQIPESSAAAERPIRDLLMQIERAALCGASEIEVTAPGHWLKSSRWTDTYVGGRTAALATIRAPI